MTEKEKPETRQETGGKIGDSRQRKDTSIFRKSNSEIRERFFAEFDTFLNLLPDGTPPQSVIGLFNEIFNFKYLNFTKNGRLTWQV